MKIGDSAVAAGRWRWLPPYLRQRNPPVEPEGHAFSFQQQALFDLRARPASQADGPARVDDSVPRHGRASGQRRHGVSHLPGAPRESSQLGHLAVSRNLAIGNAPHHPIDGMVAGTRS